MSTTTMPSVASDAKPISFFGMFYNTPDVRQEIDLPRSEIAIPYTADFSETHHSMWAPHCMEARDTANALSCCVRLQKSAAKDLEGEYLTRLQSILEPAEKTLDKLIALHGGAQMVYDRGFFPDPSKQKDGLKHFAVMSQAANETVVTPDDVLQIATLYSDVLGTLADPKSKEALDEELKESRDFREIYGSLASLYEATDNARKRLGDVYKASTGTAIVGEGAGGPSEDNARSIALRRLREAEGVKFEGVYSRIPDELPDSASDTGTLRPSNESFGW